MHDRRRGEATRERILEVACRVIAESGYRDATHAEICRLAGANAAAVNYYFASKENLYRAVFEHLTRKVERLYPLDEGLAQTAPPEKRLRAFIHAHLSRMFDPDLLGDLHRIRMAEMFDPTGLLDELLDRQLAYDREHVQLILRELLGPRASQRDVEWCEMSTVSQCFIGAPGPHGKGPRAVFGLGATDVERLTDHILTFSVAGVKAIRQKHEEHSENNHTIGSAE